jgi:RNA polymerase sigma-70 factor (ECF subfamily)
MTTVENRSQSQWTQVVRELSPGLFAYFLAVFSRETAADFVQEVLLRLVLKVREGKFRSDQGTLRMYAYGIARFVRLEGRRVQTSSVPSIETKVLHHESPVPDLDRVEALRGAISSLRPMEQEVILLLLDKDLSLREIANVLDIPVGTVKSHVHRAKENLKKLLIDANSEGVR